MFYRTHTCNYLTNGKICYVSLFKNSGKAAEASMNHSHNQLIAFPFCPPPLKREMKAIKERKTCAYYTIFAKENASSRLIYENSECIAFPPYYSMGPFEVWILPRRHVSFLGNCNNKLLLALGKTLRASLKSYRRVLGNIPFNYMFYQLFENSEYHPNLRLLPRLSISAGFELIRELISIQFLRKELPHIWGEISCLKNEH